MIHPVSPCAHGHAEGCALDAPMAAAAALEREGEQWTSLRAEVFDALTGFDQPASAYDIADTLSARLGRRIAANSVYRILDLFVAADVAKRIETRNAFVACAHPGVAHDCIYLVCDRCGSASHIDDDALTEALQQRAAGTGFQARRVVLEVQGLCALCHASRHSTAALDGAMGAE